MNREQQNYYYDLECEREQYNYKKKIVKELVE